MVKKTLFIVMAILFIGVIARVDRVFFKRSNSFSVRFLYSCLDPDPEWDLPAPTPDQLQLLDTILKQKFHYLAKGAHCFAFISEDGEYVIKFHHYPSHMRLFPWLNHPLSYRFDERRKKIKEHNLERLRINFKSYKDSYRELQEETGVILLHLNQTGALRKTISLIDRTRAEHKISLGDTSFILQKRAELIYPTLDRLQSEGKIEEAKRVVSNIVHLITARCQKGYIDDDPILRKNYGLLKNRAIHIDVGDLIRDEKMRTRENYIPHVKEMTESLRKSLEDHYPELLEHYYQTIERL